MATETASAPTFFQSAAIGETHPLPDLTARFVAGERLMVMFGHVEPNASLPLHNHPHEQISYVLKGTVHFQVGEQGYDLNPGDGLVIPGGVTHGAIRVGESGCDIIEIFTPLREEYLALMHKAAQETQAT